MRRIASFSIIILFLSFIFLPLAKPVNAAGATLFISPNSGSYAVGKSFSVKVMVDSGGGAGINAAEGTITYDTSYLSVTGVSKSGSIFSLWTTNNGEGPGYSNSSGKITFGGGSPGAYKGSAGSIFSVTFSAKKAGTANVTFSAGIVLAADGKGTNIFSGFGNGKFTLTEAVKEETKPEVKPEVKKEEGPKGILPPIPEVSSPTHPDENIWYSNSSPEFTWKILSDLINVSYEINENPTYDPGPSSEGTMETKKIDGVKDGTQYFNIKFQNKNGWGQIAHRKVLIDATPPATFTASVDNEGDSTNPTPKLKFKTTDATSGMEYYSIKIGMDTVKVKAADVDRGYYQPNPLAPGEYLAEIAGVDKAGNSASTSIKFAIDSLKPPIITDMPKVLNRKDELIIRGTSFYPQVTVKIYISKNAKETEEISVKTDDQGNWSLFHKGELAKGNYEVWAKIIDDRGAQSIDSSKNLLTVISPSIVESYGLIIIIVLLIIIACLVIYILYLKKKFNGEKERIKWETEEMKAKLRKIFAALREEADELIELVDKKPGLSESEKKAKEKIEESLNIAEEFLSKEVEDIEKEIRFSIGGDPTRGK